MFRPLFHLRVVVALGSFFWLFTDGGARSIAKQADVLNLYCTDVAESVWFASKPGNHVWVVPAAATHSITIDLGTSKVFLNPTPNNPEPPNNPALGDVVLTKLDPLWIVASNATSFTKPHADDVRRFTFTIDRRTGLYRESGEILKADNTVTGGDDIIRLCGVTAPKF